MYEAAGVGEVIPSSTHRASPSPASQPVAAQCPLQAFYRSCYSDWLRLIPQGG